MEKYYVPFDRAEKLRDLGFKEYCDSYYGEFGVVIKSWGEVDSPNNTSDKRFVNRPLFSQAFDWFREKYSLIYGIDTMYMSKGKEWDCHIGKISGESSIWNKDIKGTYEEAELACLDKLIEIANERV